MQVTILANFFINKSIPSTEYSMTHLKLQKLLYYAQGIHLALTGEKLFNERIEAWVHGPVCPKIYFKYRNYYDNEIVATEEFNENLLNESEKRSLELVWNIFGNLDGNTLEKLTHSETPWQKARGSLQPFEPSNNEITTNSMREYFFDFFNSR